MTNSVSQRGPRPLQVRLLRRFAYFRADRNLRCDQTVWGRAVGRLYSSLLNAGAVVVLLLSGGRETGAACRPTRRAEKHGEPETSAGFLVVAKRRTVLGPLASSRRSADKEPGVRTRPVVRRLSGSSPTSPHQATGFLGRRTGARGEAQEAARPRALAAPGAAVRPSTADGEIGGTHDPLTGRSRTAIWRSHLRGRTRGDHLSTHPEGRSNWLRAPASSSARRGPRFPAVPGGRTVVVDPAEGKSGKRSRISIRLRRGRAGGSSEGELLVADQGRATGR